LQIYIKLSIKQTYFVKNHALTNINNPTSVFDARTALKKSVNRLFLKGLQWIQPKIKKMVQIHPYA
jgi:hypothetical protein